MTARETRVQLQSGIVAIVSTEDDMACIDLRTTSVAQGLGSFDTKGFLLKFGLEEHRHFHLLLKQFEATINLGIDCQSYCLKAGQTDDFLKEVNQLIAEYFSYSCTLSHASS